MGATEQRELQRLRYRAGQLLRSKDFRDQQAVETQLRAWHNRALHNTYGIAKGALNGFAVRERGDLLGLTVETGSAYNCFGSELLLTRARFIAFEKTAEPMLLVARHKAGDCCHGNALTNAELVWKRVREFSFSDGVALARTKLDGGAVRLDNDFRPRHAKPIARPRVLSGTTIPGATNWEVWELESHTRSIPDVMLSMQVRIDISSAGFTTPPACFAFLEGPLLSLESASEDPSNFVAKICLYFEHVDEVNIHSFVFRFLVLLIETFPGSRHQLGRDVRGFLAEQKAYVSWLAIENQQVENIKKTK